ncbi:hypothetical protein J5834_05725 [bacterium]|nr:hypothetical protein [bacterium]
MNFFLKKGGLLLPLFFIFFSLSAEESLYDYFKIFYDDPKLYSKWIGQEKNNIFKDFFVNIYHLPTHKKRTFVYPAELKITRGMAGKDSFGYLYLEFDRHTEVEIVFFGIKSGEITVNGSSRGRISLKKETDSAKLKGSFEKGVYFVSVRVSEEFSKIPLTVLSKTRLVGSKRGFTKSAASNLRVENNISKLDGARFAAIFNRFCFPHPDESRESGRLYFDMQQSKNIKSAAGPMISLLYASSSDEDAAKELKKLGFSSESLAWWKERFLNKGLCGYEQN